ncbi:MAG: RNA 2'-phosphotransferase [Thermoguttaceae bacterium]|nr:RNA 2'-phosphotransferase [Thermoguttaceae bacterium]
MDGGAPRLNLVELSRTVSHALRHEPWLYELELDEEGWTPVDGVLSALRGERHEWRSLTEADLARMIEASSKATRRSGWQIRCPLGSSRSLNDAGQFSGTERRGIVGWKHGELRVSSW